MGKKVDKLVKSRNIEAWISLTMGHMFKAVLNACLNECLNVFETGLLGVEKMITRSIFRYLLYGKIG